MGAAVGGGENAARDDGVCWQKMMRSIIVVGAFIIVVGVFDLAFAPALSTTDKGFEFMLIVGAAVLMCLGWWGRRRGRGRHPNRGQAMIEDCRAHAE
jgi:hypothetical protein